MSGQAPADEMGILAAESSGNGEGKMTTEAIIDAALATAPRNTWLQQPVIRKIYLVLFIIAALLTLVPYWTVYYLPRKNRPRQSWTLQRCLRVRWSRLLCALVARCEIDYLGRDLSVDLDPLRLSHSHPITLPQAPSSHLIGHAADMLHQLHESRGKWIPRMVHRANPHAAGIWGKWNVDGDRERIYGFEEVKAFWFTGKKDDANSPLPPREAGAPVGIHFHGGGYLCGTAAETDLTSSIAKNLVAHSPLHHILAVDYRLAPSSPWPLPLLDAISAYHYLVNIEQIPESDIILVGDSAGGHLALALARWLRDSGASLGYAGPRGLVLLSPWVDIGFTTAWGEGKYHNADSDLIDDSFGPFATSLLLRALPQDLMHTSVYLSPASLLIPSAPETFAKFPPVYVVYGSAERLSTSIGIFWNRLQLAREKGIQSTNDKYVEGKDCVHDFLIFPWVSEEAAEIYADMDIWLRDLLTSDDDDEESDTTPPGPDIGTDQLSPEVPVSSPAWSPVLSPTFPYSRRERRISRQNIRLGKSPLMGPTHPGVGSMMGDMRSEAMNYMNLPGLDLISPMIGQLEGGEWDWEGEKGRGNDWYDMKESEGSDVEDESRKER